MSQFSMHLAIMVHAFILGIICDPPCRTHRLEETSVVNKFVIAQGVHILMEQYCRLFFALT